MGLRERVTITLVIIALIQIACRHCMPRTQTKASLKRYLNDVKPVKHNPVPTPYSPSRINKTPKRTFGKTAQNGRTSQTCLPKKSLYQTYKFPENEFPLDNSPRDPFHVGMAFNDHNQAYTLQKARDLHSSRINDLKKEMKMKRKLLGNRQINNENGLLNKEMSSIKFSSNHDSKRLLDSLSFPEMQYPLSTMETWGPSYWNHFPFDEEKQINRFKPQAFNLPKADNNNPFTRLTKAKASKYLQSYDKLKEEHMRSCTGSSKRSNGGQKGLNFTKTATCERVSDDFITASFLSNIASEATDTKTTLEPGTEITPNFKNTCPYNPMPIPYKVIEDNTQKVCPTLELKNNTKELQDLDTNDIVQTLHLLEEILLYDDTSSAVETGNCSKEIENNVNLSDSTDGLSNEDIPTTLIDAKNCTDSSTEDLSQKVCDDDPADILEDIMPSLPEEILAENTTTDSGPLNVTMPFTSTEPTTNETHVNLTCPDQPNVIPISNSNAVPGSTSIIIIPINNNNFDGKSLSQLLEQIMSSPLNKSVPNNRLHNDLSYIAPLQNDNPPSTALVSELLNSISDSGSSLPIYETLPTNSMCYNNESSPSAMKEKLISDILIHKSLTDDALFNVTSTDEKSLHQFTGTGNSNINSDTQSLTPDFKHPLFDFADGEFTLPNQGLYNNVFDNESPILVREISSDQQIPNVSSDDLFMSTQNVTLEYLHENISKDTFQPSEIANDALTVAMNQNFTSQIPTDSIPNPNNEKLFTPVIEATAEQPLLTEELLIPNPVSETLSDKLPEITDWKLPSSPVTTTDTAPQLQDFTPPLSNNKNNSPLMTDVSLKTELYKIRQILDKMLSSQIPTDSQTVQMETILLPISDTDKLPLLVNKSLESIERPTDIALLPAMDKTILPIPVTDSQQAHKKLSQVPFDGSTSDTLPLPVNKSHNENLLLDIVDGPPHPTDETGQPIPVIEFPDDNKPYLLDNLVTPLSKTHTKDETNNDLSPTRDDLPSKMDFIIPNNYEVSSDDLPHSVVDTPIIVHQKYTSLPSGDSINEFDTKELEPQNDNFDNSVSNLLDPTIVSSVAEVLKAVSPEVSAESTSEIMSGFTEKRQQNVMPSKNLSSDDVKQQQVNLSLSKQEITEDVLDMEPFLPNDSPQSVSDEIAKLPHTFTDTKDLSLVMDRLLPTEDTTNPDTLVTDTPEAVTLSLTNGQQSIDLAETTDEVLSKPTPSDITPDNLPLLEDKLVPYTDNTPADIQLANKKTVSTSKLPIAKALLENVLSDIRKGGLSSQTLSLTNGQQYIDLAETTDELLSKPTPSDITPDNLPLLEDKLVPYTDKTPTDRQLPNKKAHSNSKLPIAKALLENVLSDITKGGLSSPHNAKTLSATPSPLLDKMLYQVDVESPISEAKEILPVNTTVSITETSSNLNKTEGILSTDKMQSDTSLVDIPAGFPLIMDEVTNDKRDIVTNDIKNQEKTAVDVPLQTDEVSPLIGNTLGRTSLSNKKISYSKLPITKAILENVLSDVTSKDFSLPVSKSLPMKSSSMLEKTLYCIESPVSDSNENGMPLSADEILPNTERSDNLTDKNFLSSRQTDSSPETHKNLSEVSNLDILAESSLTDKLLSNSKDDISTPKPDLVHKGTPSDLPLASGKTLPSSKLPITKALLENVLSNIETKGFSLPGAKNNPLFEKQDNNLLSPGQTDSLPETPENFFSEVSNLDIPTESSLTDKILPNTNDDISSPKPEILPEDTPSNLPLASGKTLSSSKLPITKALLENVLSNIETKGFSLPEAKSLPVESRSQLDKTLYYMESPLSNLNEETSLPDVSSVNFPSSEVRDQDDFQNVNFPFSEIKQDDFEFSSEETTITDNPYLNISTDELPNDQIYDEDSNETSSDYSIDDFDDFPEQVDKKLVSDNMSYNFPLQQTIPMFASRIPITKALLQKVLSDIIDGGIRP